MITIYYVCKRCCECNTNNTQCEVCGYNDFVMIKYNNNNPYEYSKVIELKEQLQKCPEYDAKLAERLRNEAICKRESEYNKLRAAESAPKPKCPTCGSTNIKDISTLNRVVSVGLFGLASGKIGKTKECKSCGYKW